MYLAYKLCSFRIKAESASAAYIKGCNKASKILYSSNKFHDISLKVERVKDSPNELNFMLMVNINLNEKMKHYCDMCKEFHCSFYINEEYNCSRCNLKTFFEREKQDARNAKAYFRALMDE